MPLSGCGELIFWKKLTCVDSRVSLLRVEIENETFQGNFWESRMRVIVLGGNQSLRMGMRVLTCQMLRNMQTFLVSRWYSPTSCWGRVYGEGKPHPGKVYHLVEVYLPLNFVKHQQTLNLQSFLLCKKSLFSTLISKWLVTLTQPRSLSKAEVKGASSLLVKKWYFLEMKWSSNHEPKALKNDVLSTPPRPTKLHLLPTCP